MSKFKILLLTISFLFIFSFPLIAGDKRFSTSPIHSPSKYKKWRIGYFQGGEYADYRDTLLATIDGLIELGWIEPFNTAQFIKDDVQTIWEYLAKKIESDYLTFVNDGFYSAAWKTENRSTVTEQLVKRVQDKNDFDILFAMGTWAGQDLSNSPITTNIIVMSTSNPVVAGIIKSPFDSGKKNLHAQIDPTFHERQIKYFHEIIQFDSLGIIFENSETGKSYAGLASAQKVAKESGFDLVTCFAVSDIADISQCEQEYLNCIDRIAREKIDALYVTAHGGVTDQSIKSIVEKTHHYNIPTFSQYGTKEVEKGLLISLSRIDFKKVGLFEAAIISNVLNGAAPGDLVQIFKEPLHISINIDTAQRISYLPSADVIAAADIIFKNQ